MYKATDGTLFDDRTAYRKYEMETQYTFKNLRGEKAERINVEGQPFEMFHCEESELIVLGYCSQVQIDEINESRVFIAASSESVFVRNCRNTCFTICCQQLRTRDCENCTFYLYSKTGPAIETSTGMVFAKFNGEYEGHGDHLKSAGLIDEDILSDGVVNKINNGRNNKWNQVFDFNDEARTGENWDILDKSQVVEVWHPLDDDGSLEIDDGSTFSIISDSSNTSEFIDIGFAGMLFDNMFVLSGNIKLKITEWGSFLGKMYSQVRGFIKSTFFKEA